MIADAFLDTNILVYAAAGLKNEEAKRTSALKLIETTDFGISAQVLQEFYVVVTRKLKRPLLPHKALEWIEQFDAFPQVAVDSSLVKVGIENSVHYQISYWDGAIIAAAERLGAEIVYTEDLSHGQRFGNLRVVNPFLD